MDTLLTALRAAAEQTRLRLLALLAEGDLTVKELTHILGQSQPRISRHLKLLAEAGLVARYPEGSWVFYRLMASGEAQSDFVRRLVSLLPRDDAILRRDKDRLATIRATRQKAAQNYFTQNAVNWKRLRALHISESVIEREIMKRVGRVRFEHFVDLGTGTGRMLELFAPRTTHSIGFDVNADMLALARSHLDQLGLTHCQVRLGDMTNLPLGEGVADFVMMHQVLHFLDDMTDAFTEAARILKPNGRLMIVDFAPHDVERLRDEHAHHRLGFAEQEINQSMVAHGITPDKTILLKDKARKKQEQLSVHIWSGHK